MKVKRIVAETKKLEEFAEEYSLTLVIRENSVRVIGESRYPQFTSYFDGCKVEGETMVDGGIEVFGYGESEELAVLDYLDRISGKSLHYMGEAIRVPRLVPGEADALKGED